MDYLTTFRDSTRSIASVVSTVEVCTAAIMVLFFVGNEKVKCGMVFSGVMFV